MSPAALYIHYKTKEELLHRISRIGHDKALAILDSAASGPGSAAERLDVAVRSFVRWHAAHHTTARVVQYELDALAPEHRSDIVALRRQSDAAIRRILADGVAAGEFFVPDVPGTTLAVLSLCIDVARWFSADGRRTPDEVGALYAGLVLRMVGAGSGAADAPPRAQRWIRSSSGTPTPPRTRASRRPRSRRSRWPTPGRRRPPPRPR